MSGPKRVRVSANPDTCVTSCMCVYRAPEVFDQDEAGLVVVLDSEPPTRLIEDVQRAARGCPTRSITVTEMD